MATCLQEQLSQTPAAETIYENNHVEEYVYYVNHFGAAFEWTGSSSTMKRYYGVYPERSERAASVRIAVRVGSGSGTTGLSWLLGDHPSHSLRTSLGSTSLTVDMSASRTGTGGIDPWYT